MKKKILIITVITLSSILAAAVFAAVILNWRYNKMKYDGPYSKINGSYGGVDDLGRKVLLDGEVPSPRAGREVGIFYFLWQGQHGTTGPFDNNKIFTLNPESVLSEEAWMAAGGGPVGAHHFWGEPLFGYYTSEDEWVMRKHVQMLTDAGVDFLVFDTTNGYTYDGPALKLFAILDEYAKAGYDVPQVAYYTNSNSAGVVAHLYHNIYMAYPQYEHLWFKLDGKPMIIGDPYSIDPQIVDYFRVKANQWPTEANKVDGFPWMSFKRPQEEYFEDMFDEGKSVVNVSVAQHPGIWFSESAFYNKYYGNWSRSYHDGKLDESKDAILWGYNFAEMFDNALEMDSDIIFITGWNEWVAQRQKMPENSKTPIGFVDCCDPENSRDIEPMRDGYGDNYYIQMINYIRKYKGTAPRVDIGKDTTIDINGSFSQWDNVTAVYTDYVSDEQDRNTLGFGDINYVNTTGVNDFTLLKAAKDDKYIYFYAETAEDIRNFGGENSMTLYISTTEGNSKNWYGYEYVVNRNSEDGEMYLERSAGGWDWEKVCKVSYKLEGNKLMIAVPRKNIKMWDLNGLGLIDLQFKWVDGCKSNDIWSFYEDGDCAPYGRLNYVFSDKK